MASLWDWWEGSLDDEQRLALMALADSHVPAPLAVAVMRASYPLLVVLPYVSPVEEHGCIWRLTHEAERFVLEREDERLHPEAWR